MKSICVFAEASFGKNLSYLEATRVLGNTSWIDHFYKNSLYKSVGTINIEYLLPKGYFLWSELKTDDAIYSQGREFFYIDNGVSFVSKQKDAGSLRHESKKDITICFK